MSNLIKRIENYFVNEYDGDDKTAPKMELSVDELRYIASMHVDKCRAEAELRKLKNKRYPRTNADRIRSMSDEELVEFFLEKMDCAACPASEDVACEHDRCLEYIKEWLQSEVEG